MTMHRVIQQVRNGELETVIKEVDGREVTYIVNNQSAGGETGSSGKAEEEAVTDYKAAYEALTLDYRELQEKYDALLKRRR